METNTLNGVLFLLAQQLEFFIANLSQLLHPHPQHPVVRGKTVQNLEIIEMLIFGLGASGEIINLNSIAEYNGEGKRVRKKLHNPIFYHVNNGGMSI